MIMRDMGITSTRTPLSSIPFSSIVVRARCSVIVNRRRKERRERVTGWDDRGATQLSVQPEAGETRAEQKIKPLQQMHHSSDGHYRDAVLQSGGPARDASLPLAPRVSRSEEW